MSGPAGVGKTTTLRVVAEEMGIDLVEWGEGIEEWALGGGFGESTWSCAALMLERESPVAKVSAFLSRHSFAPLNTSSGSSQREQRPRVLLMTSLPNLTHFPTRDAFHSALLEFCKNYSSSASPLVIIHSDAGMGGRAEESWMERAKGGREGALEVVGKDIKDGPWYTEIESVGFSVLETMVDGQIHPACPDIPYQGARCSPRQSKSRCLDETPAVGFAADCNDIQR
jgi:cell cycle checkpoint protein